LEYERLGEFSLKKWLRYLFVTLSLILFGWIIWETYQADNLGFSDKTLWDWMELLVVPMVLGIALWGLNASERRADREAEELRARTEREVALDAQRQGVLNAFYDRMTHLLLQKGLRNSNKESEVRAIARALTLASLRSLDGVRKGLLVRFLHESDLIGRNPIVRLEGADLANADLGHASLEEVNFCKANLEGCCLREAFLSSRKAIGRPNPSQGMCGSNLRDAVLRNADLRDAYLGEADLRRADLRNADLRGARARQANLRSANLEGANLQGADLSGAYLAYVNLKSAVLVEAHLGFIDLRNANLSDADLRHTNLEGAKLRKARLDDANLEGAKLRNGALNVAKSLRGAIMPNGEEFVEDEAKSSGVSSKPQTPKQ
jgi:uncharacterized protein YjbI with pentapeptide repeats